jgi:glutathione synthase/RimK-type ligase-like ATP-grasp enzyme
MNALIVYNKDKSSPRDQARLDIYIDAFSKFSIQLIATSFDGLNRVLEVTHPGFFKFALFVDPDADSARFLTEEHQLPIFNNEAAIQVTMDRALLFIALKHAEIPIPKTIILPHTMNVSVLSFTKELNMMLTEINYPSLVKHRFNFEEPNYLVNNERELIQLLETIPMKPLVVQAFVPLNKRKSYRIFVLGSKVIVSMEQLGEKENMLRSVTTTTNLNKIAIKTIKAIGASFGLVYLFVDEDKKPYVYAVQTNPDIVELQLVTGEYVGWYVARHIVSTLNLKTNEE